MGPPCKGCEFRRPATKDTPSCHADCEIYTEFRKSRETDLESKRIRNLATDTLCRGIERAKATSHIRRRK